MTKTFRKPKNTNTPPPARESFNFAFDRDGDEEIHSFNAVGRTDIGSLVFTLVSATTKPEDALSGMMRMIAKMLDNRDGTPAKWRPTPLPLPGKEDRVPSGTDSEDLDEEEAVVKFRAPNGALLPMAEAGRFTEFNAGSSRRRWLELMQDDELTVDAEPLTKLFEWLVGLAAGRPTGPSA